jgi:hypothetical protein
MDPILLVRQALLFAHLVAFAIAFAEIARGDLRLLREPVLDLDALERTARVASLTLLALWLTGLGLVALDTGFDPVAIAARPKLVAKLLVVTVLTGNGILLHRFAFPSLAARSGQSRTSVALIAALGAISSVSWTYAAFVGSARLIASSMSLEAFLALYGIGLLAGVTTALLAVTPLLHARLAARAPRQLEGTTDLEQWAADTDPEQVEPVSVPLRRRA